MSVFDHFPIIEGICKHLGYQDLKALSCVSRKCAKFFRDSGFLKPFRLIDKNPRNSIFYVPNKYKYLFRDEGKKKRRIL